MKDRDWMRSRFFATLSELQWTNPHEKLKIRLKADLQLLWDILEDDIEEEWWEQIEEALSS